MYIIIYFIRYGITFAYAFFNVKPNVDPTPGVLLTFMVSDFLTSSDLSLIPVCKPTLNQYWRK